MNPTKNDIPVKTRGEMISLLNAILADVFDLFSQTKQAHWNVKGENFIALHELFDDVAEAVEDYTDEIAERTVMLGGTAMGTARLAAANSTLKEYPVNITSGAEHVAALSDALAATGKNVRDGIETADKAGDADTADLLTGISRGLDKYLWFVEAHLQS